MFILTLILNLLNNSQLFDNQPKMKALILSIISTIIIISIPTAFAETEYYVGEEITFTCAENDGFTAHGILFNPTDDLDGQPITRNYSNTPLTFTPEELGKYAHVCFSNAGEPYSTNYFTVVEKTIREEKRDAAKEKLEDKITKIKTNLQNQITEIKNTINDKEERKTANRCS